MTDPTPSRPNLRFARGELVFGYRLVRKLGEGSFGSVWLAANEKGFEWALKIVNLGGSGGQKEFKALQLIKDRKINNTSLLKLIDYGLLDRDGTSLAAAAHRPVSSPAPEPDPTTTNLDEDSPGPLASPQGTLVPLAEQVPVSRQTAVEKFAARETQRGPVSGDTHSDDQPRATWLVIVMEVGQLTLHQLQLRATEKDFENSPRQQTRAVTRMGLTAAGSKIKGSQATTLDPVEEPLVPLPVAQVLPYIEQAARGLDYLHRHDIVHRDIKPQNIILVGDDAKVCDYGLASESRNNSTATTIGCTPAYAAPEAINNRPVPASDQYSLAVTYIELITGRWPFYGVTQTAIYREKDEGKHNLTFIPNPAVRVVLKKALAKLPRDRYPTCSQFIEQLKIAEQASAGISRRLQVGAAAVLLVLVGAGAMGWAGPSIAQAVASVFGGADPEPDPNPPVIPPVTGNTSGSAVVQGNGDVTPIPPISLPPVPQPPQPPDPAVLANKELTAAFADPTASPAKVLAVFDEWHAESENPDYWWSELATKASVPAWHAPVENWLLANRTRKNPPEWLAGPDYAKFADKQQAASLQRLLQRSTSSPDEIQALLESDALALNDAHCLATLLRIDLALRHRGAPPTEQEWEVFDGQIESAFQQQLTNPQLNQRRQFAQYLRCQKLGSTSLPAAIAETRDSLTELLGKEPLPSWLQGERKAQLARPLGYVTLSELGKTDRDLPTFDQFALSKSGKFTYLLQLAAAHQLTSVPLDAAQALLLASQSLEAKPPKTSASEWRKIGDLATEGYYEKEGTYAFLRNQQSSFLLVYVINYAKLQTADPASAEFATAVNAFATFLRAKQNNQPLFFDFVAPSQPQDTGVYRHLVQPVLDHPALKQPAVAAGLDPAALATLWGVRGALLRRSPAIAALVEPASSSSSVATHILLLQHRAFREAIRYDALAVAKAGGTPNPNYLAGESQILTSLPKQDDSQPQPLADLLALVKEFDPEGKSADLELLRLGAHVRMQQGLADRNPASRKQLVLDATSRYERLLAANPPADARHHRAVACERLSELQWNLSQWTEFSVADYRFVANQSKQPPQETKGYHLWQAKRYADEAVGISNRPQPENAYLLLANAQEQLASALGQVEQFELAAQSLASGAREATAGKRSTSRFQAARGRLLLRHAQELFAGLTSDERTEKLQTAITDLTAALGSRRESAHYEPQDAETLFSLAEAHLLLAQQLTDERTQRLEQARLELKSAIDAAGKDSPRLGHYRWRLLVVLSHQGIGTSSDPSRKGREEAELIRQDVLKNPASYDPAALVGLATQAAWLHYEKPATIQAWLPDRGPLYDHWRASETAQLEAVKLYCEAAAKDPSNDSLMKTARQLAGKLSRNPAAQRVADAWIQDTVASERCTSFEKFKPTTSTNNNTQDQTNRASHEAQAKIAVNSIQESLARHRLCVDDHVKPLLEELERTSLDEVYANKVLPKLTVLEKRALWKYASTGPSLENRKRFIEICTAAQSVASADASGGRSESPKLVQDLIKPVLFFDDLKDRDPRLGDILKHYKPPAAEDKTKPKK